MSLTCWMRTILTRLGNLEQPARSLASVARFHGPKKKWLQGPHAENIRQEILDRPVEPSHIFRERLRQGMERTVQLTPQMFDYFLVLDFEATCDKTAMPDVQEIIEFPCVKVDAQTMDVVSTFHHYVLPRVNPALTPFCTQLTGIVQDMVDGNPHFDEILPLFDQWMETEGLLNPACKSCFITCGDWDLGTMLPRQTTYFNLSIPGYFDRWVNIKHSFAESIGHYPRGLMLMLESLAIPHTGRHHSGIDDCMNIVNIMRTLSQKGHVFRTNGQRATARGGKGRKF